MRGYNEALMSLRHVSGLILLLILIGAAYVSSFLRDTYLPLRPLAYSFERYDASIDRSRIQDRIINAGPERVARELEDAYAAIADFRIQHTAAHLFGELLFERFGLDGIHYCLGSFNYGCHHGLMAAASSQGKLELAPLDVACAALGEEGAGCYHGVGHGILSGKGYAEHSLLEALGACGAFSDQGRRSCISGVFMEYNTHLLEHAPDIFKGALRPLGSDPHAPCSFLSLPYRGMCYFEQASWWSGIYEGNVERIAELCDSVSGERERSACFEGMGKAIAWNRPSDVAYIVEGCRLATRREDAFSCRVSGAATSYARTGNKQVAVRICEVLDKNFSTDCLALIEKLDDQGV